MATLPINICAADWTVTYIHRSGCGRFSADYVAAYLPSALDSAYLAFTAANLSGDVDAMRTAARAIGGTV